jgi:hypothetical protein
MGMVHGRLIHVTDCNISYKKILERRKQVWHIVNACEQWLKKRGIEIN